MHKGRLAQGVVFGLFVLFVFSPLTVSAGIFDAFKKKSSPAPVQKSTPSSTASKPAAGKKSAPKAKGKSSAQPAAKAAPTTKLVKKQVCETKVVKKKKQRVCRMVTTRVAVAASPIASDIPALRAKFKNPNLVFGITLHPEGQYGLVADEQINLLKELGVKMVKIDYINSLGAPENDIYINKLIAAGIEPVVIVDWKNQNHHPSNTAESEAFGYAIGSEIAGRYNGKVKYFHLSGEMEDEVLKGPTYNGISPDDYDITRFDSFMPWLRGTLNGIKAANPDAQRIMTFQYTHTGFLDLLRDRANINQYEIIGWNIYSDQGSELERIGVGGGFYDVLSNIVTRGKGIWMTEVARRYGARDGGEVAQADYLKQLASYAKTTPEVSAFFVYEFGDQPAQAASKQDQYGLVSWTLDSNGRMTNVSRRPAFNAYKTIIAEWVEGR